MSVVWYCGGMLIFRLMKPRSVVFIIDSCEMWNMNDILFV